jgi:lipopolysaccharide export system permease protein
VWFVFLTLPNAAYTLIPAAAWLGGVTGLGDWAACGVLVAMGAAGVSPARLSASVLQAAALMMVAAVLLGELVAAPLVKRAQGERSSALSGGLAFGTASELWTRVDSSFINARSLAADGTLHGLYVFDVDEESRITRFIYAEKATYTDDKWILENLVDNRFTAVGVVTERKPGEVWHSQLKPRQLKFLLLSLDGMSLRDLGRSIGSLRERGENSERERLAFWRRLSWPLVTAAMVYIALPFVLVGLQRSTMGRRIAIGALAGVGFQMFNTTFGSFALAYGFDPRLCALLPTLLALGAGLYTMRLVR